MAWSDVLAVVAAVGAGVMGGVFFAFSVFVMRALDRLPTLQAVAAMRAINVTVITPLFLLDFVGTALLSVAVLVVVATGGFAGSAPLGAASAEGVDYWPTYRRQWTLANHVRTAAGIVAALLLALAVLPS